MTIAQVILGVAVLATTPTVADSSGSQDEPYCGLYSMYAALSAVGRTPDFARMNDSRFLSGKVGSTATDLMNLARQQGATATFCPHLSLSDLRSSRSPIVLHAKSLVSQTGFHHWIVFVGWDGDALKIYDPPRGHYLLSPAELLSQWDGIGVVVGNPQEGWKGSAVNLEVVLAFLLAAMSCVGCLRFTPLARRPVVGILAAAVASAVTWHAVVDYGFFRNRYALDTIAAVHQSGGIATMGDDEFRQLVGRKDVTIVDARTPDAYREFHIPGAVNVPITVTFGAFRDALSSIPTGNQVVVYCRSEECTWAETVAHLFPTRGYHRVAIFHGGILAWRRMTVGKS